MKDKKNLFLGVMSGTSLDGIDIIMLELSSQAINAWGSEHVPYTKLTRDKILKLSSPSLNELEESQSFALEHALMAAQGINKLLKKTHISSKEIEGIGYHGQTIRHRPDKGFSVQIGNAHLLAEKTNIKVINDFRNRDIVAGGQGAPLVPLFHQSFFSSKEKKRIILNIGGISNISFLANDQVLLGFDCGPGNILLDQWIYSNKNLTFDKDGEWARKGKVVPELLNAFFQEPYFKMGLPKSTGREKFNSNWLDAHRIDLYDAKDVQRTLLELTVLSIKDAINNFCDGADEVFVCGGGSENNFLMERLVKIIDIPVNKTDVIGVPSQHVEAMAFVWLASKTLRGEANNSPNITGSKGPRILGIIYYP